MVDSMSIKTVPPDSHGIKWEALTELGDVYRDTVSGREVRSACQRGHRAKVPGGWFVMRGDPIFFYPDPEHNWDGGSLS